MAGTDRVRKIACRVDISYGNEDVTDALDYRPETQNPITCIENLYNSRHTPAVRAFTLEGNADENALASGRQLIDPEIAGWWSTTLSSEQPNGDRGYPFAVPPALNVHFGEPRPIKALDLFGDPRLIEFPTEFRIRLYDRFDIDAPFANAPVFDRVFANKPLSDAENDLAAAVERTVELLRDAATIGSQESFTEKNGYITDAVGMTVTILAWNKPHRTSKIYRCYDNILEHYAQDELKSFECVNEIPINGEIKYGLVSNSCSVTLLNNKQRKFDLGYLANQMHINKRVMPFLNGKKLGTYFIKEWDISQDNMFVECKANDRLLDFQDMTYEGFMPGSISDHDEAVVLDGVPTLTFGQLFDKVLAFANRRYVRQFRTDVDPRLYDTAAQVNPLLRVEPYLPRDSVWAVLQALCDASLSFLYVDSEDVVCVRTELFGRERKASVQTIDPGNAFSISVPFFADMVANCVEIPYFRKTVKTDQELYKISGVSTNEQGYIHCFVELDDYCEELQIKLKANPVIGYRPRKITDFKYEVLFKPDEPVTGADLVIVGNKITFEKQSYRQPEEDFANLKTLSLYTHPDSQLLRTERLAQAIAARIMALYPEDTRTASSVWRGDEKLGVLDKYNLTDRFGRESEYLASYVKSTVDGGLRQEVKGVRFPPLPQALNSGPG